MLEGDGWLSVEKITSCSPPRCPSAGVDANLVGLALVLAVAAEDILRVRPLGLHRVGQEEGGAAGASAFRLWWASTISTSQPPKMAAAWPTSRTSRATPMDML